MRSDQKIENFITALRENSSSKGTSFSAILGFQKNVTETQLESFKEAIKKDKGIALPFLEFFIKNIFNFSDNLEKIKEIYNLLDNDQKTSCKQSALKEITRQIQSGDMDEDTTKKLIDFMAKIGENSAELETLKKQYENLKDAKGELQTLHSYATSRLDEKSSDSEIAQKVIAKKEIARILEKAKTGKVKLPNEFNKKFSENVTILTKETASDLKSYCKTRTEKENLLEKKYMATPMKGMKPASTEEKLQALKAKLEYQKAVYEVRSKNKFEHKGLSFISKLTGFSAREKLATTEHMLSIVNTMINKDHAQTSTILAVLQTPEFEKAAKDGSLGMLYKELLAPEKEAKPAAAAKP